MLGLQVVNDGMLQYLFWFMFQALTHSSSSRISILIVVVLTLLFTVYHTTGTSGDYFNSSTDLKIF